MGNDVYEEILYRHWPFPTAFSTASWLSYILLSKTEKKRKIIRFNQQVSSALRFASLRSLTRRIRRLCAAEKADGIIFTSSRRLHSARQTQTTESIIEYLIAFQRSGSIIGYFNSSCQPVENPVPPQYRMRLRRNEYTCLRIAKYVVLLQDACIEKCIEEYNE